MRKRIQGTAVLLTALLGIAACNQGGATGGAASPTQPPQRGGHITVLEDTAFAGSWPSGLDPATNTTGGANLSQMSAIYGGLFLLTANEDGSGAKVTPNQAESYEVLDDGRTLKIKIREGITFSDGTPFDAEAVRFNFERDMKSTCSCKPTWQLAEKGITTEGTHTVVLRFRRPNAAAINNFPIANVNWIASPAALEKMGEDEFRLTPVGAGPFKVVSNKLSSELVLERNPTYFKKDRPYLDRLTFKAIGGDQAAYQALLAGQAQAYEGMNTVPLIEQAGNGGRISVTLQPPTSPYVVQLNTRNAPFDDERARQAIYHATDFDAIAKGLFKDKYPVSQTFTAPGGLFHHPTVPGYRGPDLAKAKQLVQQAGGITVELGTLGNYVAKQVMTALQTQWKKAGINVTIKDYQLNTLVQQFNSGEWQAMLQTAGAWDPATGVGVAFRFSSTSPFTGVKDPHLDELLADAAATVDSGERDRLYTEAGTYISDKAYAPFGLAFAPANLAAEGVYGPGLTTKIPPLAVNAGVLWDQVWRAR
ncbi:ABC transporter substrate-binding protein [Actinomadura sp. 3N407]|uniref:ABC transporter substrate-binding protein n=1 Tax=Actinomadura sp. 3N407 TaxID=3457423 RepID=UPI003FCCB58F